MAKPSQTASNAIQQFFSPRQQIYTAKWPGIINPTRLVSRTLPEMEQTRSNNGSTKTFGETVAVERRVEAFNVSR